MDATRFSLADFFLGFNDDPLQPDEAFTEWREQTRWATTLFEPAMGHGPDAHTTLVGEDGEAHPVLNFASYNYLGLNKHPEVLAAAEQALRDYGTGSCGSPLLSGATDLHRRLEHKLAEFTGREAAMLFNSGFGGALGVLAGLLRKGDVALLDGRAHICLIDGVKLAGARPVLFDHDDPADLDKRLKEHVGARRVVLAEGIYSIHGDVAKLPELLDVCESNGVGMLVDEAHSVLTVGPTGRGAVELLGVSDRVGLYYATFSKAFASIGSFVAGDKEVIDYLRWYANSYAFSAALPASVVAGIDAALDVATRDDSLRNQLAENAACFRDGLHALGIDTGPSTTHVVPLMVGKGRRRLYEVGNKLREQGLFVSPFDYPSVPDDGLCFRACVSAAHTREDLDAALQIVKACW